MRLATHIFVVVISVVSSMWMDDTSAQQTIRSPSRVERTSVVQSDINTVDDFATTITASDRAVSSLWEITPEEAMRVRLLMKGIRGTISVKNISPYEVLGIHARSEAERRQYAERFARMMVEDTQRVLAFNTAYLEAHERLYPGAKAMRDVPVVPPKARP
jgi:hypothetical protein